MLKENASKEGFALKPEDIVDAVAYVINKRESVAINEILIRPALCNFLAKKNRFDFH
ncbi:hypothetical protein LCM00_14355 [Bacillus infantis]|uniref:hypothetical protein n=1 Tax=Bacillus infantis TaxID=324767 RepID=UPI001CD28294|nr:hypothetical protein [Bacillus infantis]MCA1040692.1 hypothetical protein [Bacillus infantis]